MDGPSVSFSVNEGDAGPYGPVARLLLATRRLRTCGKNVSSFITR